MSETVVMVALLIVVLLLLARMVAMGKVKPSGGEDWKEEIKKEGYEEFLRGGISRRNVQAVKSDVNELFSIYANEEVRPADRQAAIACIVGLAESAVDPLVNEMNRSVGEDDWRRASYAAAALSSIGPPAARTAPLLLELGNRAESEWEDFFGDEEMDAYKSFGSAGIPFLRPLLASTDNHIRWNTLWALQAAGAGDRWFFEELVRILQEDGESVGDVAVQVLRDFPTYRDDVAPHIFKYLERTLSWSAALGLVKLHNKGDVPTHLWDSAVSNENPEIGKLIEEATEVLARPEAEPFEYLNCRLAVLCGVKHPKLGFGALDIARKKGLV